MSITTKTGDRGMTSLYLGGKVSKDSLRVEVNGTLDELCCFLGMSKCLTKNKNLRKLIESIQQDLFIICSEVASKIQFISKLKKRINIDSVSRLEKVIKELETKDRIKMRDFCLPGKNFISSTLDVTRTIVRRAERKVVTLSKKKMLKNNQILIYLNRLSDLLFLLARKCEKR